jgi:hypothetical protein
MAHEAVARHLQELDEREEQHDGDDHHVGLEALIAEADRQIAEARRRRPRRPWR